MPSFGSFDNLSEMDLFPSFGPRFELVNVGHAHTVEVQITPCSTPSTDPPITLGIFASVLPSWYFAATAAQMTVSWVVCLDSSNKDFFLAALGSSIPLFTIEESCELAPVHIIAVNDVVPRSFQRCLFSQASAGPLLIFDTWIRRVPPGLHKRYIDLGHGSTGGVTDGQFKFTLVSHDVSIVVKLSDFDFPIYPNDALISILSRTVGGSRTGFKASRVPSTGSSTSVLPVYSNNHMLYYGNGLCPHVSNLHEVQFLCPCVYPSTPWLRRKLTTHELGLVFDLPSSYTQRLGSTKLTALTRLLRSPVKPMSVLFLHLFRYAWPESASFPSNDDSAGQSSPSEFDDSPGGGAFSVPSQAVLVEEQVDTSSVTDILEVPADEDNRNAVAVKSDDAPVPVFVWRRQLERILDISIPENIYERGADLLRAKLLCMWRRGLLRHFWLWVKSQHPELNSSLVWCKSQFGWSRTRRTFTPKVKCVHWNPFLRKYSWFCKKQGAGANQKGRFKNLGLKR